MSRLLSRLSDDLQQELRGFHDGLSSEEKIAWHVYTSSVGQDFSSQGETALTNAVFREKGPYLVMMAVLKLSGLISDHNHPMSMSAFRVILHAPTENDWEFPYFKSIFAAEHILRLEALATEEDIIDDILDDIINYRFKIKYFQQRHVSDPFQPLKVHLRLGYIDRKFSDSHSHVRVIGIPCNVQIVKELDRSLPPRLSLSLIGIQRRCS